MPDFRQTRRVIELDELREEHLGDRPSRRRRLELIERVRFIHSEPLPRQPSALQTSGASRHTVAGRRTGWALLLGAALGAAGAAATFLAPGILGRDMQRIEAEPPAASVEAGATPWGRPRGGAMSTSGDESGEPTLVATVAVPSCIRARGDDGLLNDFERPVVDGETISTRSRDGRTGEWFHVRNMGGSASQAEPLRILPSPEQPAGDEHALRIAGPPRVGWGANAGIRFSSCYDASAYAGLELRARGRGALFVGFQTLDSVPTELGGRCTNKCWFTGGRYIVLSEKFTTHRILWRDVSAPDPTYDVSKELMQLTFSVQSGPEPYEFWLDDLRLIPEGR